jgi:hypothetical protein
MSIDGEGQPNPDQGAGTANLKSELRDMLAKDFKRRLTESQHISEEQCKRLCGLLADGSISASNIVKALKGDEEKINND